MKINIEFYKKINQVKSEIGVMAKKLENPFYKSSYFDINELIAHVEPLLNANGLMLMQPVIDGKVVSRIIDLETGDIDESSIKLPEINDPQKLGSAITFYRRYSLQSQLAIQAEDDDANKASGKDENKKSDKPEKPWLNPGTTQWNDAINYLKGDGTLEKIKGKYNISKKNEEQLKSDIL